MSKTNLAKLFLKSSETEQTSGQIDQKSNRNLHTSTLIRTLVKRANTKNIFFLFLNQKICCGYSKEPSQ